MKKTMYEIMLSLIEGNESAEANEVRDAINTELTKGKAKADANRAAYGELHDKVMAVLASAVNPVTAGEISEEIGESRSKISYGLKNYWADEVLVTPGKVNSYSLA